MCGQLQALPGVGQADDPDPRGQGHPVRAVGGEVAGESTSNVAEPVPALQGEGSSSRARSAPRTRCDHSRVRGRRDARPVALRGMARRRPPRSGMAPSDLEDSACGPARSRRIPGAPAPFLPRRSGRRPPRAGPGPGRRRRGRRACSGAVPSRRKRSISPARPWSAAASISSTARLGLAHAAAIARRALAPLEELPPAPDHQGRGQEEQDRRSGGRPARPTTPARGPSPPAGPAGSGTAGGAAARRRPRRVRGLVPIDRSPLSPRPGKRAVFLALSPVLGARDSGARSRGGGLLLQPDDRRAMLGRPPARSPAPPRRDRGGLSTLRRPGGRASRGGSTSTRRRARWAGSSARLGDR